MALSKLSKKRRLLIKYLLAEEIEDEELIFEMYGRKRAKTHVMFVLRSEEGMYKKLIVNHLREDPKKFAEFFLLSLEQFDFLVELIIYFSTPLKITSKTKQDINIFMKSSQFNVLYASNSPGFPTFSATSAQMLSFTLWSLYLACESCHNEGCFAISSTSISSSTEEILGAMMAPSLHE